MMLDMRVARIRGSKIGTAADSADTEPRGSGGGVISLEKIDEMIGKDIEEVLRHRMVPGEYIDRVGDFVRRVEVARGRLGGADNFEHGERLGDVVKKMRRMGTA